MDPKGLTGMLIGLNRPKGDFDSTDLKLLEHAAEVTLDCGQFQIAGQVAARWRALAPGEAMAYLSAVGAQLGQARIADARTPLLAWLNSRPAPGDAAIAGAIDWLAERCGTDTSLAMLRGSQGGLNTRFT